MKTYFITFATFIIANSCLAQNNTFPTSGNVGIGTLNPSSKLSVAGNIDISASTGGDGLIYIGKAMSKTGLAFSQAYPDHGIFYNEDLEDFVTISPNGGGKTNPVAYFSGNGKVGIATTSPIYTFQVQKTSSAPAMMIGGGLPGSPRLQLYGLDANAQAWMGLGTDMSGAIYEHSVYFSTGPSGSPGRLTFGDYNGTTYNTRMTILQNGNVGVGTSNPTDKFAVNGNIRAKEIKVEATNWPDYVFDKDYQLTSLSETAKHIKEKGHLPGIPSAAEVATNGVELGEMNKKLLEKIEELTLHLIVIKEENDRIKTKVAALEKATLKK